MSLLLHATKPKSQSASISSKRRKGLSSGTELQPVGISASQLSSQRLSPRKAIAASKATEATANTTTPVTFELRLRKSQPQDTIVTAEGSKAATIATAKNNNTLEDFDAAFANDFNGIDWLHLPRYMKPLATQKQKTSWVYLHGYRVVLRKQPDCVFFVCRYCHAHKSVDRGSGSLYKTTTSTSTSAHHLEQDKRGHQHIAPGKVPKVASNSNRLLRAIIKHGRSKVTQDLANELAGFNFQEFCLAAVDWLVENNHSLSKFTTPAFHRMLEVANPEAMAALWTHHQSVACYVMRLYKAMQPSVKTALSKALSKIHISFDGWTTRGGKRGFLGVVAHYVSSDGEVVDLPIALPQMTGAHSSEKVVEVVNKSLQLYGITPSTTGYFVLDNASNNDTAILALTQKMGFIAPHRRLRCAPHTLNLIGQTLLWGNNADAYKNCRGAKGRPKLC
jgi:hypothetical protein